MEYTFEIKHISKILDELNAMEQLPKAGTPLAMADHDGWVARHQAVLDAVRHAESYALLSIPAEVFEAVEQVRARMRILLNIPTPGGTAEKREDTNA